MVEKQKVKAAEKQKVQMEFTVRSSPKILYSYLSTPDGLAEWFADDVTVKDGVYTFHWEGDESRAKMANKKENVVVRYKWLDVKDDSYIEFEIQTDDLTSDVALMVTDFVFPDEKEETHRLWESQVLSLRHLIGS